jgi:glycosyltransferase involved in cell wall biosynthesis
LRRIWASNANATAIKRIVWFIPSFDMVYYGGIFTILSFAEYWRRTRGVKSFFAVCGAGTSAVMSDRIGKVYKGCSRADVMIMANQADVADLPQSDACIATLWTTVFYALRYHNTGRHFYFIQDYEPAFYRAGSSSAIAASTYRAGFYGIANTVSLRKTYEEEYGGIATHFTPCVDPAIFHARGRKDSNTRPWKVFVYARPQHPRNSFELIAAAVRLLKDRLGDSVTILTAGAEWNVEDHNLSGVVEHLGLLPYADTAALYRTCDVGVALMFTRHPSYLPFELMACGCLVVTNLNSWNSWFFQESCNCVLARSTASCLADAIEKGLRDRELRERVTKSASATISRDHSDWSVEMEHVYEFMCDPTRVQPYPESSDPLISAVASGG